jgi:hypothetical protein
MHPLSQRKWTACMDGQRLIPTSMRCKIPRSLSYPIGAQAISNFMFGIPIFDELSIWFTNGSSQCESATSFIRARYKRTNLGMSASHSLERSGFYGPSWDIWVYAVPCNLNATIREFLKNEGLMEIRNWLEAPRSELWLTASHSITMFGKMTDQFIVSIRED